MINMNLKKLRQEMANRSIDAYIIPNSDPHMSEYLPDHYQVRPFISGFTGSAGTVIITKDKAGLWTDGRYFIQAEQELKDTDFKLYKMGVSGVPTMVEFLLEETPEHGKIGVNGLVYSYSDYRNLRKKLGKRMILTDITFAENLWENRPELPKSEAFIHEYQFTGCEASTKLSKLRTEMREKGIDYHFLGSLEDICYLFNLRGSDIDCNPLLISYALISRDKAIFYIDPVQLTEEVENYLEDQGITPRKYDRIFEDLKEIPGTSVFYYDPNFTNVKIRELIPDNVRFKEGRNITTWMKAIKNKREVESTKNAFIKDGVALVKFLNWIETGANTELITENYASDKLLEFRKEGEYFIEPSFGTISAYGENAALAHYSPDPSNPVNIKAKGMYLVDSGGHYLDGTTDITRTIKLGEVTEEEIDHFTLVLKGHIALSSAIFLEGTKSSTLDILARGPLWRNSLNFNHGTGHGVGHVLSVHEGPQNIAMIPNDVDMLPGMITSNEPGMYVEGSHGIRIENILLCVEKDENEYGKFYAFENLSWCPIDTRLINFELLTQDEIDWINDYHKTTYEKLSPYLDGDDLEYLERRTEEIDF